MISLHRCRPRDEDRSALVEFLTRNEFPFHVHSRSDAERIERLIEDGAFDDEEHETFWVEERDLGRVGIVTLEDLRDPTPLFDLRLAERYRGRGLGRAALAATTEHVFETMPEVRRFEGQTREDNVAMRRAFLRSGWVKEAHYRESWPVLGGAPVASVAYAILRRDWESGTVTTFEWEDVTL